MSIKGNKMDVRLKDCNLLQEPEIIIKDYETADEIKMVKDFEFVGFDVSIFQGE